MTLNELEESLSQGLALVSPEREHPGIKPQADTGKYPTPSFAFRFFSSSLFSLSWDCFCHPVITGCKSSRVCILFACVISYPSVFALGVVGAAVFVFAFEVFWGTCFPGSLIFFAKSFYFCAPKLKSEGFCLLHALRLVVPHRLGRSRTLVNSTIVPTSRRKRDPSLVFQTR